MRNSLNGYKEHNVLLVLLSVKTVVGVFIRLFFGTGIVSSGTLTNVRSRRTDKDFQS